MYKMSILHFADIFSSTITKELKHVEVEYNFSEKLPGEKLSLKKSKIIWFSRLYKQIIYYMAKVNVYYHNSKPITLNMLIIKFSTHNTKF